MCAISGSSSLDKAFSLYTDGLERGHYGSGLLALTKEIGLVYKQEHPFTLKDIHNWVDDIGEIVYWAFHSRAPTNVVHSEWSYDNTHPFNFGMYYVAQNGIIDNFTTFPESAEFEIDTSIIPYHLTVENGNIKKVFSKYTGLLTSWVYDLNNHRFYLIKAGSSLFRSTNSFSSVEFINSVCVDRDGIIYELKNDYCLHEVDDFDYNNPYFLI
jgi:predicted glutamine amidotransferase